MVAGIAAILLAATALLQPVGWVTLTPGPLGPGEAGVTVGGGRYYVESAVLDGVEVTLLSSLGPLNATASLGGGVLTVDTGPCGVVEVELEEGRGAAKASCGDGEVVVIANPAGGGGGGRSPVYSPRYGGGQGSSLDGAARALSLAALALAVVSEIAAARRGGG